MGLSSHTVYSKYVFLSMLPLQMSFPPGLVRTALCVSQKWQAYVCSDSTVKSTPVSILKCTVAGLPLISRSIPTCLHRDL